MAINSNTCCARKGAFYCSRNNGHQGQHEAAGADGHVWEEWSETPVISPTIKDLRAFAQYALSSAHLMQCNLLSDEAKSLYGEWSRANEHARHLLADFETSVSSVAVRRALGMLLRPQIARDIATDEVHALLRDSETLKDQLADGDWQHSAEVIARACIDAYHAALVEAIR